MIIENVANDDVFKTVDMYFRGLWDKNRTIEELRYYKPAKEKGFREICLGQEMFLVLDMAIFI